jgi:hypothetical protein
MVTLDEIKSLSPKEKWLIFSALQDDADVLSGIYNNTSENDTEEESVLKMEIDDEQILKYIKIVDYRVANGTAEILSMEEVLKRLKAKRNAIKN